MDLSLKKRLGDTSSEQLSLVRKPGASAWWFDSITVYCFLLVFLKTITEWNKLSPITSTIALMKIISRDYITSSLNYTQCPRHVG